jgi:hypothetical protein
MKDVFTLVQSYMSKLFSGIEGMKLLLVDRETVYFFHTNLRVFIIIDIVWNY